GRRALCGRDQPGGLPRLRAESREDRFAGSPAWPLLATRGHCGGVGPGVPPGTRARAVLTPLTPSPPCGEGELGGEVSYPLSRRARGTGGEGHLRKYASCLLRQA